MPHDERNVRLRISLTAVIVCCVLIVFHVPSAVGQLPSARLASIFPPGSSPAKTVDVTIKGQDLDDVTVLRFSHPGITAKQKMAEPGQFDKGPVAITNQFAVSVAGNVPPGVYDARVVGKYGISNPRAFTVGTLSELIETEPNNKREEATNITMPAVVNGQSDRATDVDWFKFSATAGQRLLIDCQARRIDSFMDPIVSVYDAIGRELDSNRDSHRGDPLLDFTAPATGDFFVQVKDSLYRGNDARLAYFYRLSVGALTHIDFVFPPAGTSGSNGQFTVYGRNLPGGQPSGLNVNGKPLQKLQTRFAIPTPAAAQSLSISTRVDSQHAGLDGREFRIKGPQGLSNPVLIGITPSPVVIETEPNSSPDKAQQLTIPCDLAGQFYPQRDNDWFTFDAKKGDVFTIEVISQRTGINTDPSFLLQQVTINADGKEQVRQLLTADDQGVIDPQAAFDIRCDDPSARFVAPADATYRILVRDSYTAFRNDPRSTYRLSIRKETPDFRLAAAPATQTGGLFLRKGGSQAIDVIAWRRDGFDGEITVTATGLPAGVTCPAVTIGPTRTAAKLVLTAADNAATAPALIQVTGKATIGSAAVTRTARTAALVWPLATRGNNQQISVSGESRICRDIAIAVSSIEAAPVLVTAGDKKVWETSRGGILKIPYQVVRRNKFKGNVLIIARNLPAGIASPVVTVNGTTASGTYELKLTANTPPGTHTFFFDSFAQNVSYARNPEVATAAAAHKVEFDKLHAAAVAAAKTALQAKQVSDKRATDTANLVKTSTAAKAKTDKTAADATIALKAAMTTAAQAKTAAAKKPDDTNLKSAVTATAKAITDATTRVKAATDAVIAAQKKLDAANAASKTATEAKSKTDAANDEAVAYSKAATENKAKVDKRATDTANAAKPANRNVFFPSSGVTLKIVSVPIALISKAPTTALKQSQKLEIPVSITRLYSYPGPVTLNVVLPSGVGGISIPNVSIAQGQTQSKLTVTAAANATVGKHELVIRATLNFNGQNLSLQQPVTLTIQKVEPKK